MGGPQSLQARDQYEVEKAKMLTRNEKYLSYSLAGRTLMSDVIGSQYNRVNKFNNYSVGGGASSGFRGRGRGRGRGGFGRGGFGRGGRGRDGL